ncbi:MAG: Uma2 family endonuclease, partial [Halothece sp.]
IFVADQRLWIPEFNIYTYPDVMVIQRPVMLQQGRNDTVTNPLMIAEIISQSTRSYDKDEKFTAYRSLPTFQEYLLIDQYQLKVERYSKFNQKQWLFSEYTEATDKIVLSSLPFEIQLGDLYSDLDL